MSGGERFQHDPTDSEGIPGGDLGSFEQAKEAVDNGAAEGRAFVVTRFDPFLVIEVGELPDSGELPEVVSTVLERFGPTFTEADDDSLLRLFYRGELPGRLHGGEPVVVSVRDGGQIYPFRLFDSGWTPVSGRHVIDTPDDVEPINPDALKTFLTVAGKL